jgi:hypothetical protein
VSDLAPTTSNNLGALERLLRLTSTRAAALPVDPNVHLSIPFRIYTWEALDLDRDPTFLARGAHKLLYRGVCAQTPVAIADLISAPELSATQRSQFLNSIEVLLSVPHPRIVQIMGVCVTPPHLAIVMPLYPRSLRERLHARQSSLWGRGRIAPAIRCQSIGSCRAGRCSETRRSAALSSASNCRRAL